jgi:hypothetical protein
MDRLVGEVIIADTSSTLAPFKDRGNSTSIEKVKVLFPMIKGSGESTTSAIFTGETETRLDLASLGMEEERTRIKPIASTDNLFGHHLPGKIL